MEEKAKKRRDWIKNAIIIFLVVMLLLTFFSNTIMNYSLPEVSAQYTSSGNIASKIRGTASVEAIEPYEINVDEARKVKEVKIHSGDTIKKGQVLFVLGPSDGSALTEAEDALDAAMYEYQQKRLADLPDYITQNLEIKNAEADYKAAVKAREKARTRQEDIKAAQEEIDALQIEIDGLTGLVEDLTKDLETLGKEEAVPSEEQKAFDIAEAQLLSAQDELKLAQEKQKRLEAIITRYGSEEDEEHNGVSFNEYITAKNNLPAAVQKVYECEDAVTICEIAKNKAERALNAAKKTSQTDLKKKIGQVQAELDDVNNDLTYTKSLHTEATRKLEELKTDVVTPEAAQENIKTAKRNLEKLIADLEKTQGTDANAQDLANLELSNMMKKINKLEKKVAKLRESSKRNKVKSKVNGIVSTVNYVAGDKAVPETPMAVVELTDRGYSAKLSVTNEQSRLAREGTAANILNVWDSDIEAVLTSIKNDPDNPGTKKILTFTIKGDVTVGQSLDLSVGDKSSFYDVIVPNSAIHEDNKGKFILTVQVKSSPLGNRYIASRMDVEVLASDETSSAITGSTTGSEFIITTSTKPITPGMQVRLIEGDAW